MKRGNAFLHLLGYYVLSIPSQDVTDLLNLCMRYGFVYYGLTLCEDGKAEFICSRHTAKKLLSACKSYGIPIRIEREGGAPRLLYKYRARAGLFVGLVLSVALFCLSQSVLWRINVKGNERLTREEVTDALEAAGLYIVESIEDNGWCALAVKKLIK